MTDLLTVLLLSSVYLISRFINLTALPVFGDEAIYIRWSQIIKSVETLRFIPVTDGKQPLFMWATVPFFKIIADPLFASRTLSVLSGLGILLCIYLILRLIFKTTPLVAFIGGYLYLISFFSFFFDRLATADTLLSFFTTLSLFLVFLLAKHPRLDTSLILGGTLGLAWLTKSPALYFIVLNFVIFILYNYKKIQLCVYPIISTIIATAFYNILRLGPQFNQLASRNKDYVWPISEIIKHPLDPFKPHLSDTITIYSQYFPPLFLITITLLFVLYILKKPKIKLDTISLILWFGLPLVATLSLAKVFTARYILFTLPPFIILVTLLFSQFSKIKYFNIFVLIYLSTNLFKIWNFETNLFNYHLPSTETGYIQDWTSGWGIKPSADFLIDRSKTANVIVGTEGYFGTLPDGLQIYTNNITHLTVFGVGIGFEKIPEKLIDAHNHGDEVYILGNSSRIRLLPDEIQKLTLINTFPKPNNDSLVLYRL